MNLKKVDCPACGKVDFPLEVEIEYLKPMRDDQPRFQFSVKGSCKHRFKVSAKEMGIDPLSSKVIFFPIIKEPLWVRIRRAMTR